MAVSVCSHNSRRPMAVPPPSEPESGVPLTAVAADGGAAAAKPGRSGASRVAAGILASRVAGFLRDRALAHVFGVGAHADVFRTALRGPNVLQNLPGEGTPSA